MEQGLRIKIADIVVEMIGDPLYIHDRFYDFTYDGNEPSKMTIRFKEGRKPLIPLPNSPKWVKMGGFWIYKRDGVWYQWFPYQKHEGVSLIVMKNDFHDVTYYICDKKDSCHVKKIDYESYSRDIKGILLNLIQETFFNMILYENGMSIHSASLIYKNKGIVFSAPSGTGKSTQSNMWHDMYGYEILDGDTTICREIDNKLIIYGLPWCGTSNLYMNRSVELDSIVFLSQGPENVIHNLNQLQTIQYVFASSFSEAWDDEMAQKRAHFAEVIVKKARIVGYECNMDSSAVTVLKDYIDSK